MDEYSDNGSTASSGRTALMPDQVGGRDSLFYCGKS